MIRPIGLAPCASKPEESRGRLYPEAEHAVRSPFQRDRDRIIHSTAFRRLTHKTQVFVYHEGDHYRTRLTHTLEVAQISRTISRALALDEDLAETLALAHDLGHTPFGHAGEEALNAEMARFGGFSHNDQTLRILTCLERRYAEFDGLNLTWESLEGTVKHNGPLLSSGMDRAVPPSIAEYDRRHPLWLDSFPSAEAQVAALADDIAYNNHDVDDGLRAGSAVRSADEVRRLKAPVVGFSSEMSRNDRALKEFLFERMYRHHRVNRMSSKARRVIHDLFSLYLAEPQCLPREWRDNAGGPDEPQTARVAADYLAGMTDRFALDEHHRLFDTYART